MVEWLDEDEAPVVSGWSDECPVCDGRAIFLVRANGKVSFRCPACHEEGTLTEAQEWLF